jgi:hypothetical protein
MISYYRWFQFYGGKGLARAWEKQVGFLIEKKPYKYKFLQDNLANPITWDSGDYFQFGLVFIQKI